LDYERLGAFYLGKIFDHKRGETSEEPLLYDSKDLTTHGVCVGMTGSGKTGLCISLLEEAAIDGIPAIAIDPKGDLGNLMLTFPNLAPSDFEPWIDPAEAARKGETCEQRAAATATLWRDGLAKWGQGPERIAKLRAAVDIDIYTPGSSAGKSLTVLRSFAAPPPAIRADPDALREQVSSAASGLLALLGIDADPLRSREHILVATILQRAWQAGESLDLAGLIHAVQAPEFDRVGVLDLEQFYPSKDRAALAMSLNGILASPGFAGWLTGEPLDIKKLLWTSEGKPKISILNIAHLSESERMFFVTILLNEMVSWMRTQSGTSSLRALLYMDEVFGYFPPVANPPSKRPMLTLLKQARAYGLGVMLATQNPVDLDYKGLSNTGTWFIGRLQTERDVARVVDGLEGAASAAGQTFNRQEVITKIAGLGSRVFLLNNVHEDAPVSFKTRWALSYLRGPLTRDHIRKLAGKDDPKLVPQAPVPARSSQATPTAEKASKAISVAEAAKAATAPPKVPGDVSVFYAINEDLAGADASYVPQLWGSADLHYVLAAKDIDEWKTVHCCVPLTSESKRKPWTDSALALTPPALAKRPDPSVGFSELPSFAEDQKSYESWAKSLKSHLYKECSLTLFKCTKLKMTSTLGEDETDFRLRVRDRAHEKRNVAIEKLRQSYGKKLAKLKGQIERAGDKLEKEKTQLGDAKMNTALSAGTTVLGALFGRKVASIGNVGRASSTAKRAAKISKEAGDVTRANEKLLELRERLRELEAEFQEDISSSAELVTADQYPITTKVLRPRKSDIEVDRVALLWLQREP
tara:strand:- start:23668 stop:26097 length:2430 start_codon:yes stop_codon:yes gene_type:complete